MKIARKSLHKNLHHLYFHLIWVSLLSSCSVKNESLSCNSKNCVAEKFSVTENSDKVRFYCLQIILKYFLNRKWTLHQTFIFCVPWFIERKWWLGPEPLSLFRRIVFELKIHFDVKLYIWHVESLWNKRANARFFSGTFSTPTMRFPLSKLLPFFYTLTFSRGFLHNYLSRNILRWSWWASLWKN